MQHAACVRHAVAVACLLGSALASATQSVEYRVTDLPDATIGQDAWRYHYLVSGSFGPFDEITILFEPSRVASFAPVSTPDASWQVVSIAQPLPFIPADGVYSVKALTGGVLAGAPFIVDFVRKGGDIPANQAFEILDGNFNLLHAGMTTAIPEPRGYLLMAAGLIALLIRGLLRPRRRAGTQPN